jgi:hypothetical protein
MSPDLGVLDAQQISEGAPAFVAAAGSVVVAIRWYRSAAVQAILPAAIKWHNLPQLARYAVVFGASLLASWAAAIASGQGHMAAMVAAIPVAAGALSTHKATRAVGYRQTARAIERKGASYEPGSIRTGLGVVFPVDRKAVDKAREARGADNGEP